jgi:hypothetical protein
MPESNPAVRQLIETRLDALLAGQEASSKRADERFDRLEAKVDKTNGRVTGLELREEIRAAVTEEHRKMDREHAAKQAKWTGIVPVVVASVTSGLVLAGALAVIGVPA